MTNEEAIKHLETYSTTNGSGQTTQAEHEEAKRVAIKALETIPKYKDAYNKGWDDGAKATYEHLKMCEEEQEPILDKIRAEIERVFCISVVTNELRTPMEVKTEILQIIDKYKAESEVSK